MSIDRAARSLDTAPRAGSFAAVPDDAATTHRIRLTLHYDGSAFYGWQLQPRHRSVQGELEAVLGRLFARPARVIGAGRTDRGVHAVGQVAAVDSPRKWTPEALRRALNALLPADVWVEHADLVARDFHPRFDAVARSYTYYVGLAPRAHSPFHRRWCWPLGRPLDVEAMQAAAEMILGEHSFLAFAKAGQEERGDRCTVTHANWSEWDDLGARLDITANRFLHHMVRYLVGTMVAIGQGERPAREMQRLLANEPELLTSPPAPPEGLFLVRVTYPEIL